MLLRPCCPARRALSLLALTLVAALPAPGAAGTLPLRAPQVAFASAPLQGILDQDYPGIDAAADQLDVQSFDTAIFGGRRFGVHIRLGGELTLGIYATDSSTPLRAPLCAAGYPTVAFDVLTFGSDGLRIDYFAPDSSYGGSRLFAGIHQDRFGFCVEGPCGTWFSEDARNAPPGAQVLTYWDAVRTGETVICFETCPRTLASTYTGALLDFESIAVPVAAPASTWGRVKARYR